MLNEMMDSEVLLEETGWYLDCDSVDKGEVNVVTVILVIGDGYSNYCNSGDSGSLLYLLW